MTGFSDEECVFSKTRNISGRVSWQKAYHRQKQQKKLMTSKTKLWKVRPETGYNKK